MKHQVITDNWNSYLAHGSSHRCENLKSYISLIFSAHLNQSLSGIYVHNDVDMKKRVTDWFNGLAVDFYESGTQSLIT
jgi:hypothetical protein